MINTRSLEFELSTPNLKLLAQEAPWDSVIYRVPVVQIQQIEIHNHNSVAVDYARYASWIESEKVGLVSCRLEHDRLKESIFLEKQGFRFIEMVLHPRIALLNSVRHPADDLLIAPADKADLSEIQGIAEQAFGHERYHVDPRLEPRLGDLRYGRWVQNTLHHPSQRLLKVMKKEDLIGFFIVEFGANRSVYWHLTAIAPQWQGHGYGRRVWQTMLSYHQAEGYEMVSTTISARNTPVLNLYAQLQFRFSPPEMTFHWIREVK